MPKGYFDPNGLYIYGEDDTAQTFSALLNRSAQALATATPLLVARAVASDKAPANAAALLVTAAKTEFNSLTGQRIDKALGAAASALAAADILDDAVDDAEHALPLAIAAAVRAEAAAEIATTGIAALSLDVDGVPYYDPQGVTGLALDVDGIPYLP